MCLPTLSYARARLLEGVRFFDLRSPAEFQADHLPGASNVPLFDDEQRAVVGTLYKQAGPGEALARGLEIVTGRLPLLLERILGRSVPREVWVRRFEALAGQLRGTGRKLDALRPAESSDLGPPARVLHCWRGGMRSRSMVALLRALGEPGILHLEGGYKQYRAWVRGRLAAFPPDTPLVVLRGPAGVGKTRVLHALEAARPGSTLDLEGLARHRSSVLGAVGMQPATAKAFESGLAARLEEMGPPPWFVEGESRKVGDVVIPEPLFQSMETATQVRLDASLEHRLEVLGGDYLVSDEHRRELARQLPFLERRLGHAWTGRLRGWLAAGQWRRVAATLLERYYDVRYSRSDRRRQWAARLSTEDPDLIPRLLDLRKQAAGAVPAGGPVPCADSSA